jgi:hypothetical protein
MKRHPNLYGAVSRAAIKFIQICNDIDAKVATLLAKIRLKGG